MTEAVWKVWVSCEEGCYWHNVGGYGLDWPGLDYRPKMEFHRRGMKRGIIIISFLRRSLLRVVIYGRTRNFIALYTQACNWCDREPVLSKFHSIPLRYIITLVNLRYHKLIFSKIFFSVFCMPFNLLLTNHNFITSAVRLNWCLFI